MQLALERCAIRAWRPDDAASLAKHANNRRVWLGLRDLFPHPYTIEDANEFLRRATTDQTMTNFCIDIDRSAVGGIGIRIGQDVHRYVAELGFWLVRNFGDTGLGRKSSQRLWIIASRSFRFIESMLSLMLIIPLRHAFSKRPVLF